MAARKGSSVRDIGKTVIITMLTTVLAIGGCGNGNDNETDQDRTPVTEDEGGAAVTSNKTSNETGRYVEEKITLPDEFAIIPGTYSNGTDLTFYDSRYYNRNVIAASGEITTEENTGLKKLDEDGYFIRSVSESPDGAVIAFGYLPGDNFVGYFIAKSIDGGDFQVSDIPTDEADLYPQAILAYDVGYLIQYGRGFTRQYDMDGNMLHEYSGGYSEKHFAVNGNNFAIIDADSESVSVYDISSGGVLYKAPFDDTVKIPDITDDNFNMFLGVDSKGIYLALSNGIYRYDGTAWNMEADGNLTSLPIPDLRLSGFTSVGDEYYAFIGQPVQVMRYAYDPDALKYPDTELEIFSLYDNMTMRKAAGEFRRNNPDVAVNLRVAMDGADGATAEDVIRALNTEILAGNGPDLIVLDGLPVESYIEKGVLKDISALTERLKTEGLPESMAKVLEKDGKVYGLPSRFSMPIMLGDLAAIESLTSPAALAEQMGLHQTETPALLKAPDELYVRTEPGVMMDYYDICQDDFLTGKTIDEAALADFYKNTLAIDTSLKATTPETEDVYYYSYGMSGGLMEFTDMGVLGISAGSAKVYHQNLNSMYLLSNISQELGETEGMGIAPMFGRNKFYPGGSIGVLNSGENQELAEEFISAVFSREVQDVYLSDGFPVNSNALQAMVDEMFVPPMPVAPDGTVLEERNNMGFPEMAANLSEPVFVNSVIKEAVNGQIEGLLAGTVTPEQAAVNVVSDTRLYLSE